MRLLHRSAGREVSLPRDRKRLLGALLLLSLALAMAFPVSAAAAPEGAPAIKSMRVSIWPEYDDPRVLVMYEGEFDRASTFPQGVKFLAPGEININQVCALKKPDNEHLCQLYQTGEQEGSTTISYTLPIPTFFLEYYYDGISGQADKGFVYEFKTEYPIENLLVEVQQPLRSSNFTLHPTDASITSDAQGFKYYNYSFQNVAAGQTIAIDAAYSKTDSRPSVSPAQTGGSGGSGGSGSTLTLLIPGIIGAVALAVVGWFVLFQRRRPAPRAAAASSRRAARPPQPPGQVHPSPKRDAGRAFFCSHCGIKLGEAHNFCPRCGTKSKGLQ